MAKLIISPALDNTHPARRRCSRLASAIELCLTAALVSIVLIEQPLAASASFDGW